MFVRKHLYTKDNRLVVLIWLMALSYQKMNWSFFIASTTSDNGTKDIGCLVVLIGHGSNKCFLLEVQKWNAINWRVDTSRNTHNEWRFGDIQPYWTDRRRYVQTWSCNSLLSMLAIRIYTRRMSKAYGAKRMFVYNK